MAISANAWNSVKDRTDVACASVSAVMGPPANATKINVAAHKFAVVLRSVVAVVSDSVPSLC